MISPLPPGSWGGIDDVIIVGGGLAGLFCALKLAPRPVTVLTSAPIGEGASSASAQAGIAAINSDDSIERRIADTIAAGAGLVDERVARSIASEAADRIDDLRSYGAPFDKSALAAAVRRTPSIRVLEGYVAEQLRAEDDCVTGLVARDRRGGLSDRVLVPTRAVVLATGGIGHLYEATTNPPQARGEGLAMAARAGALIADAEFVQFHPAMANEARLDPAREPVPIAPAAHYHIGGVHVDGVGRTTLDGLWACGEVAATGAHGASCLASNALTEAVVYAARVADDIHGLLPKPRMTRWPDSSENEVPVAREEDGETIRTLRATMSRRVGMVRNRSGLTEALAIIGRLSDRVHGPQIRNALVAAKLIAAAALKREESRGAHFRSDFPQANPPPAVRMFSTLKEAEAIAGAATTPLDLAS